MAITGTGVPINRSNIQLPPDVSTEIIQKTQEASVVMTLARQEPLPGNGLEIPIILSDPEAEWVSETENKPVSTGTIDKKIMRGYTLAVIVPFSNQFRRDAKRLYDALIGRLPGVLANKYDNTVFFGQAPGSDFDTFENITAQDIGGTNTYDGLVAADGDIADHDGILNGFAISPKAKGILLAAKDTTERPLFINNVSEGAVPMILGAPTKMTKAVYKAGTPNVVGIAGDWTKAVYGIVEGVNIDLSNQATLTLSSGETLNLWQRNMFAVRAEIEIGFRADTTVFNALTAS